MAAFRFFRLALVPMLAAAPVAAQQGNGAIIVSSSACESIAHVNDAPGVAYVAGADVEGNAVPPADLPTGDTALNQAVAGAPIKITVDLRKRFGIPANASLFQGRSQIGYVTIEDGKAYLDGQPLNTAEQRLLVAACAERKH